MLYPSGWRSTLGVRALGRVCPIVIAGFLSFNPLAHDVLAQDVAATSVGGQDESSPTTPAASLQNGENNAVSETALPAARRFRPRWVAPTRAMEGSTAISAGASSSITEVTGGSTGESVGNSAGAVAGRIRDWPGDVRVEIHAPRLPTKAATDAENALRALGVDGVESRLVKRAAPMVQVRYFYEVDSKRANELVELLAPILGDVDILRLTFYRPRPKVGLLELWLP